MVSEKPGLATLIIQQNLFSLRARLPKERIGDRGTLPNEKFEHGRGTTSWIVPTSGAKLACAAVGI